MVLHLPDSWSNWNLGMLVLRRGENWSTQRKSPWSKGENQQQTQPMYGINPGNWTRATLVGGSALTTTPPLLPSHIIIQFLKCKIPERVLLTEAIFKRFSKVLRQWKCAACHPLQFSLILQTISFPGRIYQNLAKFTKRNEVRNILSIPSVVTVKRTNQID